MKASLPTRRLIPRWRPVAKSLRTAELTPTRASHQSMQPEFNSEGFERLVDLWNSNPTTGVFGDLLSFSLFPDCRPTIARLATDAARRGINLTSAQLALAGIAAEDDSPNSGIDVDSSQTNPFRLRIRELRRLLRGNPANPFALLDYAQLQLAGGNEKAADRAIRAALSIQPNNVLVLRTTARYLVHCGDGERAHALISRHPMTRKNPWLMASELALADAAGVNPLLFGAGRRLLEEAGLPPAQLTELAGALSFHQLKSGNLRSARQFFAAAAGAPNDNVAAQLVTDQYDLNISINTQSISSAIEAASEAKALSAALRGDSEQAVQAANDWHCEEPFSSRPSQFLCGLLTFNEQFESAMAAVKVGLRADPRSTSLLINLCYLHAALGNTEEAVAAGRRALHLDAKMATPFIKSTMGLLAIAGGDFGLGDRLYSEAMETFGRQRTPHLRALCAAFYARTARDFGHERRAELFSQALDLVHRNPSPESVLLMSKLAKHPLSLGSRTTRRTEQYTYHPANNTLVRSTSLTRPGAPLIVWADN